MDIDWRQLFNEIRVPWKDRGSNTSSGNVNICCPFCGDDEGYHLSVSEEGKGYYCYRSPSRHSGGNLVRLVASLGVSRADAIRLINARNLGIRRAPQQEERKPGPSAQSQWERFRPAAESTAHCNYLISRGFFGPQQLAHYYDLRYAQAGRWAERLILPIKRGQEVVSWTARDITGRHSPKYLALGDQDTSPLYIPDLDAFMTPRHRMLIVEGPLDALKIAWAMQGKPFAAVALTGKNFSASRIMQLKSLSRLSAEILVALDRDAKLHEIWDTVNALRAAGVNARRFFMPNDFKDAGEMRKADVESWLNKFI